MKRATFRSTMVRAVFALVIAAAFTSVNIAAEKSQTDAYKKIFSKVAPPELPAKAAELVSKAPAQEQKATAVAVVRAAVQKSRVSAPFIVSAVAKAVPTVAAVAAATAVSLEPKQAGLISKAATAAAPSRAGEIVLAMCKQVPGAFRIVAIGASEAAPAANQNILNAVSEAIPSIKMFVEEANKAPISQDGYASAMVGIIQRAESLAVNSGVSVPPATESTPLFAPPPPPRPSFVPGGGKPGETNRAQTVLVQPGEGRIYSGP
jgi:hypothetical protein